MEHMIPTNPPAQLEYTRQPLPRAELSWTQIILRLTLFGLASVALMWWCVWYATTLFD
jgi:hypothetical protein